MPQVKTGDSSRRWFAVPGGRDAELLLLARVAMSAERALVGVVVTVYLVELGFSAVRLAFLFGVVAGGSTLMSAFVGFAADRVGRKPFLVVLPLLTCAGAVVFMITDNVPALFIAAAVGSFGQGSGAGGGQIGPYTPAEQALLAGLVSDRGRPRLFGLVGSASALGGLIGALLVALPTGSAAPGPTGPGTYRIAFGVAAVLAFAAAALAAPVRERVPDPRRVATAKTSDPGPAASKKHPPLTQRSRGLVMRLWATNITNGIAVGMFGPFVTYWFYTRFGVGTEELGVLYMIVNVVTFFTNFLAAPAARRLGVVRTVVAARFLQGAFLIVMVLVPWFPLAGLIYLLRMTAQRFGMVMRQSFVMSAVTPRDRARVAAYGQVPNQGLSIVAPGASGYLFQSVSLSLPFELAGVLQLINAVLFYVLFRNVGPAPEEEEEYPPMRPAETTKDQTR